MSYKKHSDSQKEDSLLDETMALIAGYEEGLAPRDFSAMADCTCGQEEHDKKKNKK